MNLTNGQRAELENMARRTGVELRDHGPHLEFAWRGFVMTAPKHFEIRCKCVTVQSYEKAIGWLHGFEASTHAPICKASISVPVVKPEFGNN